MTLKQSVTARAREAKKKGVPTAQRWEPIFREFISHMSIDSKETGITPLTAENIYGAQNRFLSEVCSGLDAGIRDFKCLKARQLGITTIALPIDLFWLYMYPGTQGALLTDDEANREKFRIILRRCIDSLPKGLRIGIKTENRNNLVLNNGSVLDYIVAGKKKKKGGVAVGRAYNFLHATEVSNYGDAAAIDDFINTLALTHPNRLYIFESTARGYNLFWDMWEGAKSDNLTQKAFFVGWWAKEVYRFKKGTPEYRKYWDGTLTDEEQENVLKVREKYGVKMSSEQIAWYRWMSQVKMTDAASMSQSYPWTEEEAFVATGQSFFPLRKIGQDIAFLAEAKAPYKAYRYHLGQDFLATEIEQVFNANFADLRVWEEPQPNGIYAIGVDPAFGRSDFKDRHAIEVWRCYADRMNQVAEYAIAEPETYQITYVLAHLAGAYRDCLINLEVSGPGGAIIQELRHLRDLLDAGLLTKQDEQKGVLASVFDNVRWYLYNKPDSPGRAGFLYGWKTNQDNKLLILNQLRDNYATGLLGVRSMLLLEEMQKVVQDGSSIAAEGRGKDDRVFAAALANKAWIEWLRPSLIANRQTYVDVTDQELRDQAEGGKTKTFVESIVTTFFKQAETQRFEVEEKRMWATPFHMGVER